MVFLPNTLLGAPENMTFLRWGHQLGEMLRPAWNLVETSRERHQGDHRAAGLGLKEEAEAPDREPHRCHRWCKNEKLSNGCG